ncbi:MAG TPA: hypothetical protein VGF87_11010 [Acidimicrobiales bacterium]|jgi:hypothetical protein
MKLTLRILLRLGAIVLLAGAVYLVLLAPKATVASDNLAVNLNVAVQCSSELSQWTHGAKPASLEVNNQAVANLPAAQNACASATKDLGHIAIGAAVAALLLTVLSFLVRRPFL